MNLRSGLLYQVGRLLALGAVASFTACDRPGGPPAATSKNVQTFTSANFEAEVLASPQPVLVDFWAEWCGPCKVIAPVVSQLADDFEGKARVGKVDVDAETGLAKQYNISAIPTLLIFKDGQVVQQLVGLRTKNELQTALGKYVAAGPAKDVAPAQ